MGVSRLKAAENRAAILTTAERLFRERGIDGVGLTEVMHEAGFTQGGFYNHFKSKEALAGEVVAEALTKSNADLEAAVGAPIAPGHSRLARQAEHYLSSTHCQDIQSGCAVAGLAGDVRRLGQDAQLQFAQGVDRMIDILAEVVVEDQPDVTNLAEARAQAIAFYCELIGALVLTRAVVTVSPSLGDEILASARRNLTGDPLHPAGVPGNA